MDGLRRRLVLHPGALLLVLVFALGNRRWPGASWWPHLWTDVWWTVVFAAALAASIVTARRARGDDVHAWRWIAAGAAAFVAGQLAWNGAELSGWLAPFPWISDLGWLACGVLTTIGLVRLTDVRRLRALPGVRSDLTTLIAGLTLVVVAGAWGAFRGSRAGLLALATAGAYVVVFAAQLAASIALAWTPSPWQFSAARWWLVASSTANVLGFVTWQFPLLAGTYSAGYWFDSLWVAAGLFLSVAARDYARGYAEGSSTRAAVDPPSAMARLQLWSLLQAGGLLFVGLLDQLYDLPTASLVIGGGAFAAVVGLRQVATIREERELGEDRTRLLQAAALLARVTSDIHAGLDRDVAIRRALGAASRVFGCRDILLRLVDARGVTTEVVAMWRNPAHGAAVAEPRPSGLTEACLATQAPIFLEDIGDDPRVHPAHAGFGVRAIAVLPLLGSTGCLGVLVTYFDTPRTFPAIERTLLEAFAAVLATALENASLFAQVQAQIVELRQVQEQAIEVEKLSALRQLVSGAAHALNNPLTAVLGSAYLADQFLRDPRAKRYLDEIRVATERAARIIRSLREFAREKPATRRPLDFNELIERVLEVTTTVDPAPDATIVRDLDPGAPRVVGDALLLQQVVENLVANACQAVAGRRGTVTVRTRADARTARMEVVDDGPGVPAEVRKRIFDPFFTTRAVGEGLGLGLSVAHGIVAEHGGRIWLEETSEPGACFVVELPLRPGERAGLADLPSPAAR